MFFGQFIAFNNVVVSTSYKSLSATAQYCTFYMVSEKRRILCSASTHEGLTSDNLGLRRSFYEVRIILKM